MNAPIWILTILFWLHMLATVTWIGSLVTLSLVVLPAVNLLAEDLVPEFLSSVRKKINAITIFSLLILAFTGLFQMSANSNYEGVLRISNLWSIAMLFKHLAFLLVVLLSAYISWILIPDMERNTLIRRQQSKDSLDGPSNSDSMALKLQHREKRLLNINIVLAVLILGLTALARVS